MTDEQTPHQEFAEIMAGHLTTGIVLPNPADAEPAATPPAWEDGARRAPRPDMSQASGAHGGQPMSEGALFVEALRNLGLQHNMWHELHDPLSSRF